MQRPDLRALRGVVELRLPARRPLQRGDRRPLRRTEEGRASSEPSSRITCTGTTTSGPTRHWATCRRSSSGRRGRPSRNRPNRCCQSRPTSRWGRGAGSVAGKGDRQHREPLRRADLQSEDQAGLRSPQQAELPRQDLQGRHARLQRIPQGEQGGWLPLPKQSCHIVAAVPGAVRSSCRIFRKRSGTSASSIFCGASTVPASFAVS